MFDVTWWLAVKKKKTWKMEVLRVWCCRRLREMMVQPWFKMLQTHCISRCQSERCGSRAATEARPSRGSQHGTSMWILSQRTETREQQTQLKSIKGGNCATRHSVGCVFFSNACIILKNGTGNLLQMPKLSGLRRHISARTFATSNEQRCSWKWPSNPQSVTYCHLYM